MLPGLEKYSSIAKISHGIFAKFPKEQKEWNGGSICVSLLQICSRANGLTLRFPTTERKSSQSIFHLLEVGLVLTLSWPVQSFH